MRLGIGIEKRTYYFYIGTRISWDREKNYQKMAKPPTHLEVKMAKNQRTTCEKKNRQHHMNKIGKKQTVRPI